jgi:hypothetical protein
MASSGAAAASQKKNILVMFDVDGTLTPARKEATAEMLQFLKALKGKVRVTRSCYTLAARTGVAQGPPRARATWLAA